MSFPKIIYFFIFAIICVIDSSILEAYDSNPKIMVVKSKDLHQYKEALDGFLKVLREARINFQAKILSLDEEQSKVTEIIKEINYFHPDLILTIGTKASQEISQKVTDVPILFTMVLNPKAQGLIKPTSQSEIGLSGACLDIPIKIQFRKFKEFFPQFRKLAVLYNPELDSIFIKKAELTAKKSGLKLISAKIKSEKKILSVLESIRHKSNLLWIIPNPYTMNYSTLKHVFKFCIYNNFPVFGFSEFHVQAGALFALRADYHDNGKQAGQLAVNILRKGSHKKQVVIEPEISKLFINKKTAHRIGIKISESAIIQAEHIYE